MNEWRRDEGLGLYRLYSDDEATSVTSVVDWNASRAEQLEQLGAVSWLPEYQVASLFETIVKGAIGPTKDVELPPGRLTRPTGMLATVVDLTEGEDTQNPLRSNLWPVLDLSGEIVLEPGEELITALPVEEPLGAGVATFDEQKMANRLLREFARQCRLVLTNRRLIVVGDILVPKKAGSDYAGKKSLALSLLTPGLFMPGFDDLLANRRAKSRKRAVESLRQVMHIQFEFLTSVARETSTLQPPKPLLAKKPPPYDKHALILHFLVATGYYRVKLSFPKGTDGQSVVGLADSLIESLSRDPQRKVGPGETTTSAVQPSRAAFIESGERVTKSWPVSGAVPFSIPAEF